MKYSDLIQFEPIEDIIKLADANSKDEAKRLVKTYVISDGMADSLMGVVIPQLQFNEVVDNKGIFIVGNYGTGKSHLMSVISTIAEDESLLELVKHEGFKERAGSIAGKFEVVRFEIGGTKMDLRDIILTMIEEDLKRRGINYKFPPVDKIVDNKRYLVEMMGLFEEKYPDKGYLIVVDELLDYLQHRKELEIKFDLGFLREIGEVSKNTRIRFIAGVQETLFDNPAFSFVAKTILKVKDRFEQITIKREDISYVVSRRLLQKDREQLAWIREHLQKFGPMYKHMSDRTEEYTNLFPIHPAFLDTFEKVYIAEKREVLKTITKTIRNLLDKEVPEDEPGIISYDTYWNYIKDNPSNRTDPDIKEVVDKSGVLEGIITNSFTRPQYKSMAVRIIHALSVHRLTTGSISLPLGITVQNMKDDLCIYDPMLPEMEEDFLITTIETVMREITNTVSGQFIEYNPENEQYYLDLKKDVDYNARIQQKADMLDDDIFNNYYFDIINKASQWDAREYVPGFKIYEYELLWHEKNVTRLGYRFLGTPSERSTAQPPRDFYVYFMPPYGPVDKNWNEGEDEVYFEFTGDDRFKDALKMYAAAHELAIISPSDSKAIYIDRAKKYQQEATFWISKNVNQCFNVNYRGDSQNILNRLQGRRLGDRTLKELIDMASSACLSPCFNERYPRYPRFSVVVTSGNINQVFKNGMDYIAGKVTDTGAKVMDSLQLLDGDTIGPDKSVFGKHFIKLINDLPFGKVLNRSDIIERINEDIEYDNHFKLEPIWVALIMSAMVHSGDITFTLGNNINYDATMLKELAEANTANLINFKHCERPKDIPIAVLKKLFEMLELAPGTIVNANTRDAAVSSMLVKIDEFLGRSLKALLFLNGNINLWGKPIWDSYKVQNYKDKVRSFKDFLDTVKIYNTPAKLKNFKYTLQDMENQGSTLKILSEIDKIKDFKFQIDVNTTYLSNAEMTMKDKAWIGRIRKSKTKLEDALKDVDSVDDEFIRVFSIELAELKKDYISIYMGIHKKHRLDMAGDNAKKKLMQGKRLGDLKKLTAIEDIVPKIKYNKITDRISGLNTCYYLTEGDLETNFICPHCRFNPSDSGLPVFGVLDAIEAETDKLFDEWTAIIVNSVEDPMVRENIVYLKAVQQKILDKLLETRKLPKDIDGNFISAVNTLMQGLEKVEVSIEEVKDAIFGDGPAGVGDIRARFEKYLDELVKGRNEEKVRLIIK